MCLGLVGRVVSAEDGQPVAEVEVSGVLRDIDVTALTGTLEPGEYVLIHSGIALERLSAERAAEVQGQFRG